MPIGWTRRPGSAGNRSPNATARNQLSRHSSFDQTARTAIAIADDIVIVARRALEAEIWTRWETASDEKVCPICGPYAGHIWKKDDGPHPPLHPNCRCQRVYAFTTWTTR